MNLNTSIRQALLRLWKQNIIVASWGISNICIKESCFCFSVESFKYKGVVVVSECGDGYKIILGKNLLFCKLDSLVEELDEFIEKTSDYENRIERFLNV